MGVIFRATDTTFAREVAVKVLREPFTPASGAARRFVDEARITGQLQHPAIPPAHDVGTLPDGRPFLVMKLIKGETLDDLLRHRPDPAAERGRLVAVFEQVCQAIAYAHSHQVIHRDLKPSNVMVGAFGEVQVMDWGLAKVLSDRRDQGSGDPDETTGGTEVRTQRDGEDQFTQAGSVLGTPAYMPREQAIGAIDQIDRRSDVFGLGGILAAVLPDNDEPCGRHAGDVARRLRGVARSVRVLRLPGLPPKGDATDWLEAGGTREQLYAMAADTREEPTGGDAGPGPDAPEGPRQEAGWRCQPVTSAVFATGDYRQEWLVKRLMVKGQPMIVAGPQKTLKTSILVDLVISLASGRPFLSHFDVYKPQRVLFLSGESGAGTLQETALRVAAAKGVDLAGLPIFWQFDLPQLALLGDLVELEDGLRRHQADAFVLDPVYLSLLSGGGDIDARSVFEMGNHLRNVAAVCQRAGATPILAHHANRRVEVGGPMELGHLAYAGFPEFARQWLLLNRVRPYDGDGEHALWLSAGGSAGQGGLWQLNVSEGVLGDNFTGRRWKVAMESPTDARQSAAEAREEAEAEKRRKEHAKQETRVLVAIDAICLTDPAASKNQLSNRTGYSSTKVGTVLGRLMEAGLVEPHPFVKKTDRNRDQTVDGYRRPPKQAELFPDPRG
jgi:hypothetical protein